MKTPQQILAQMPTPGRSTPARQVNIEGWAAWFQFQTLNEPDLEKMIGAAANFILDVRENKPCPWLVLIGTSGAGKTHIARRIWRWWDKFFKFEILPRSGQFCKFPNFIKECKGGDYGRTEDLTEDRFIVLDDIGAGADPKPWIASTLLQIIENRLDKDSKKATVITANLSLEQIGEMYDTRIASRLIRRGQDKVVEVNVTDFKLR